MSLCLESSVLCNSFQVEQRLKLFATYLTYFLCLLWENRALKFFGKSLNNERVEIMGPEARFFKVPETFRARKAVAKSRPL